MIRITRLATLSILLLTCYSIASAQPPGGTAFTWNEYTGTDGKKYLYPQWGSNADGTVYFMPSSGTLTVGDYTATKAVMRLEVPGPLPGSWVTSFEKDPATVSPKDATLKIHILSGSDPNLPKKSFAAGSDMRISWIVELEDANKNKATVTFGPYVGKTGNAEVKRK